MDACMVISWGAEFYQNNISYRVQHLHATSYTSKQLILYFLIIIFGKNVHFIFEIWVTSFNVHLLIILNFAAINFIALADLVWHHWQLNHSRMIIRVGITASYQLFKTEGKLPAILCNFIKYRREATSYSRQSIKTEGKGGVLLRSYKGS